MNTPNNINQACPSGQDAAGSATPVASVRFDKSGLPEGMKRQGNKFSTGANAGQNWLDWLEEEDNEIRLRVAYENGGMREVMRVLGLKKTQAYELVAYLGLRQEKIAKDNAERARHYGVKLFNKRRRHLREHYGWLPGMNCCFLKSFEKFYNGAVHVGRQVLPKRSYVSVSKLPTLAVRDYMKKHGLQYYVMKYEVVPVEKVPDTQVSWIAILKRRSGPVLNPGRVTDWADAEMSKFVASVPEMAEESFASCQSAVR